MLPKQEDVDMMGDYTKNYAFKTRFSMLGPVASGKSTIAAAFVHTCSTMSSIIPNFYCRVLPTSTHILSDANNLCLGHFPKKTDPFAPRAPEAGLLICTREWRNRKVQVPLCDVAGEITDYIQAKASGANPAQVLRERVRSINTEVVNTVRDSQGYIIALAANDALFLRDGPSTMDPDVYTYTVLNEVFEYRRKNHKPDPHIIVVLTKWDKVMKEAKEADMNIYDESQNGLARFMANGFPNTSMLLKPLVEKGNVKFFRSWFTIKRNNDGQELYWGKDGKPTADPSSNNPVIDVYEDADSYIRWRPKFADEDYVNMVRHIGSFGQ
jgi:hypothetical protein